MNAVVIDLWNASRLPQYPRESDGIEPSEAGGGELVLLFEIALFLDPSSQAHVL